MKKAALLVAILFGGLISAKAQTGEKNFIDRPYIEVTGKAEMEVVPDKIYMDVVLNEKDNKQKMTLSQMEKGMITSLKNLGIDTQKQVYVKDIASNFKNYWIKSSDILTSKEYQVIVYDAKTAGQVLLSLEKVGISNITIEKVENSQIEKYRKEVKINAVKSAKEKADDMAKAIGQTAGKALYIQENENVYGGFSNTRGRALGMMVKESVLDEAASINEVPDIQFENIKLEYQVSARFELN